jgi:hypothetical protein
MLPSNGKMDSLTSSRELTITDSTMLTLRYVSLQTDKHLSGVPQNDVHVFRCSRALRVVVSVSKSNLILRFLLKQVDSKAKPAFPRQTSVWWFDCKSAQHNPMGLSSEIRTSIFLGNQTIEEHVTPSVSAYSSHLLELKDHSDEVEMVREYVLKGHQNAEELTMSHEQESFKSHAVNTFVTSSFLSMIVLLSIVSLATLNRCLKL